MTYAELYEAVRDTQPGAFEIAVSTYQGTYAPALTRWRIWTMELGAAVDAPTAQAALDAYLAARAADPEPLDVTSGLVGDATTPAD